MNDYKKAVENLAATKSDFIFRNSSPDHASVVLSTMLKYSNNEFRIYDDNLSGDIADKNQDFYLDLENYIKSNKKISIVVDSIASYQSRIYTTLIEYKRNYPKTVFISKSSQKFRDKVNSIYNKPINFALGDSSSFRLEEVDNIENVGKRKAFCCFNNTEISNKLKNAFDSEFNSCQSI